ncbi:MAG TPA: GTP-binding protein [Roseiflexaceae bacterium]|nr:GTP-binding protein [Roseiflexaceae bacterium]
MAPTPLTILTGFLGAGKTTLLNRILREDHGLRIAVVVNDFGALNIDAELIVGVEEDTVRLSNGCICCSIRDDLLRTVALLVGRADPPDHVLIECSGVSEPAAVAATFQSLKIRPLVHLDSIIALVDAEQVHSQPDYADLIEEQIAAADIVIINKIDLASANLRAGLREWIGALVPQARILEASYAGVPLELIFDATRMREAAELPGAAWPDHSARFRSWSYQSDRPFRTSALRRALLELPPQVFRAKGVLALTTPADRRAILQLVGRRITLTPGEPWSDAIPQTQLILIGGPDLETQPLHQLFDECLDEAQTAS